MQVCRICIAMDRKLFNIKDNGLEIIFQQLTGFSSYVDRKAERVPKCIKIIIERRKKTWSDLPPITEDDNKLPNYLCWECAHQLRKCSQLRFKALKSYDLIIELLHKSCRLSVNALNSIDRQTNQLTSTLTTKFYENNHNNIHLYDTTPIKEPCKLSYEEKDIQLELEVKNEIDQDVEKCDADKNFDFIDNIDQTTPDDENFDIELDNSTSSSDIVLVQHKVKMKLKNRKKDRKKQYKEELIQKIDRRRKPAYEGLNTDLFDITELSFEDQITEDDNKLPNYLCWECAHQLRKCSQLRFKALKSYDLIIELLHKSCRLSVNALNSIDRQTNQLTSTLTTKFYENNHNNIHLYDTTPIKEPCKLSYEEKDIQLELEVKNEIDQDVEKCDADKNFDFIDNIDQTTPDDENFDIELDNSTSSSDIVLVQHKVKMKLKNRKKDRKKQYKEELIQKIDRRRKPAYEGLNTDLFDITELSFEDQVSEILKRQESSNYKKSEFKCTECFKGFLDEDAYKCHMIRHTNQSGSHECRVCKVHFKTQCALRNHASSHVHKFSCRQCSYVTTRRHAAKLHEEYHNGTRYPCPHCHEDFGKFSTYMSHIRIKHPSDFVCELCGYSFVSTKGLSQHKKLKHRFDDHSVPAEGPYCEQCEVRFLSQEALHRHLKLSARHKKDVDAKENGARKRVRRESEKQDTGRQNEPLKKTRSNCKPEGPIPCEQCELQLPDSISYYRHFRRSHPDKNRTNYPSMKTKCMCEVCGKMFQSLALLQDHSFTHTDSKQFKCPQCDKTFQRKYRLIAHRKLHGSQRTTHACSVCGKRFSTASNLHRHMVSHTGLKAFKCEMCGKCFKHKSEKRVHITYVHLKKPWPKRSRGKRRADGRPSPQQIQPIPTESDIVQPLWPGCNDPKISDIVLDKPVYYNIKM